MYYENLKKANEFTKSIGLPGREIASPSTLTYLNSAEFFNKIGDYIKINSPEDLVAKCNLVSEVIREVIEKEIGCKAYLTIGDVTFNSKPFFNMDEQHVKTVIQSGKASLIPQKYNHHAWITLESMEIIDFTLNTSMALLSDNLSDEMREQMIGGVLSGHADKLTNDVVYHPILIGEDFYTEYDSVYSEFKTIYLSQINSKGSSASSKFVKAK